jgi:ribosome-associated protein
LKQLQLLQTSRPASRHLSKNSKLYKTILRGIFDKKGEQVVVLDLRKIPEAVADFFVVCEAGTYVQIKAIADKVQDLVKLETGEGPYRVEGQHQANWVLIDYVNIIVHIMHPETRQFYKLEEMWSDAELLVVNAALHD